MKNISNKQYILQKYQHIQNKNNKIFNTTKIINNIRNNIDINMSISSLPQSPKSVSNIKNKKVEKTKKLDITNLIKKINIDNNIYDDW